ncbi:MAG: potassium-transporting ATPase subunit C [Bacteroidota bacterium]
MKTRIVTSSPRHLVTSLRLTLVTLLIFGVLYPLLITGIAYVTTRNHGKGDMSLIGQSFSSDKYFNGRPSAVGYNAAATGGSNKGPSNPEYLAQVEQRINDFMTHNPTVKRGDITVDLVTASGGGLDPHISVKAAVIQADRIAIARGLMKQSVIEVINANIERPLLGLFGSERVNVLNLNIALDQIKK